MTAVTVSPKFQVVIPKDVREAMGIYSGQKIQVGFCLQFRFPVFLFQTGGSPVPFVLEASAQAEQGEQLAVEGADRGVALVGAFGNLLAQRVYGNQTGFYQIGHRPFRSSQRQTAFFGDKRHRNPLERGIMLRNTDAEGWED